MRSVATLNGVQRTTTFVSSTQVNIQLTAADLAVAAFTRFKSTIPPPGGGTSLNPWQTLYYFRGSYSNVRAARDC